MRCGAALMQPWVVLGLGGWGGKADGLLIAARACVCAAGVKVRTVPWS
jgi:hypothetical protein